MARCEKCFMDPCLCHIGGFGPDEEEDTTEKDFQELIGRRCIVKTIPEGDAFFSIVLKNPGEENRATDVEGIIDTIQGIVGPGEVGVAPPKITKENPQEPFPKLIYLIKYLEPINGIPAQWYLDEEVIYL